MEEAKYGLGDAAINLDLTTPMRSRISDTLVPPPMPRDKGVRPVAHAYDPKLIAEKIWSNLMSIGAGSEFEARFHLRGGRGFTLMGERERFGSIQPIEPFMEVHERLLEVYRKDVVKIDIFMDEGAMTFSSYDDLLEWLEI